MQGLDNAIIKGVDGIVMSPIDARALGNTFDMAQKKGIPIIVIDAPVNHPAVRGFFGTDNLAAAQGAGRYIVEQRATCFCWEARSAIRTGTRG